MMSDGKKFHLWIKGLLRWEEECEKLLNKVGSKKSKKSRRSKSSSLKRYYVGESHPEVYLTQREFEIATLLVQDYRYKSISQELSLSIRTIEFYIQNMKLKLHCQHKNALITVLKKIEIVKRLKT